MKLLVSDQVKTASGKGRLLTVDPPGDVNIEECEDENDGAEDRGDDVFESRHPEGYFRRRLLDWKGRVCGGLGAVVGPGVRRRC